jgi:acetyl esterase
MSGPQLCKEAEGLMRAAREAALPPVWELEPGEARQRLHGTFTGAPVADELVEVSDVGLPAWVVGAPFYRRYVPDQPQDDTVVLFFHGGGWVVNSVATHDNLCRRLAGRGNVEVLSLEYPLAPEYPYPAAINAGAQWIAFLMAERSISDETRIIVAGDSSGASVGLALAQRSYMGDRISACISLYPAVAHYTRSSGLMGNVVVVII